MDYDQLHKEVQYKAVRSAGPGGQHVNKVSSKVVLTFPVSSTQAFALADKNRLLEKWAHRLTNDQELQLSCGQSRSQMQNKSRVWKRFIEMVELALAVPKTRKETKIPKSAIRKRLKDKQAWAEIKKMRRKPKPY